MAATQAADFENDFTVENDVDEKTYGSLHFDRCNDFEPCTKLLKDGENKVGRLENKNDIVLVNPTIGREHSVIDVIGEERRVHVKDLASTNGTFWKSAGSPPSAAWVKLPPRKVQRLRTGDQVRFGLLVARVQIDGEVEARAGAPAQRERASRPPVPFDWDSPEAGTADAQQGNQQVPRPAEQNETQAMGDDDWGDDEAPKPQERRISEQMETQMEGDWDEEEPQTVVNTSPAASGGRKSEHMETQIQGDWDDEEPEQKNEGIAGKTSKTPGQRKSEHAETQIQGDWDDEEPELKQEEANAKTSTEATRPSEEEATQYVEEWDDEKADDGEAQSALPPPPPQPPAMQSRPSEDDATQYVEEWDTEDQAAHAPAPPKETKPMEDEVTQYVPEWDDEGNDPAAPELAPSSSDKTRNEEEAPTQYVEDWDTEDKKPGNAGGDEKKGGEEEPTQVVPEWDVEEPKVDQASTSKTEENGEAPTQVVPEWDTEDPQGDQAKTSKMEENGEAPTQYVAEWDEEGEDEKKSQDKGEPQGEEVTQYVPEWDDEVEEQPKPKPKPSKPQPQAEDPTQKVDLDDYTEPQQSVSKLPPKVHPSEEEPTQAIDMDAYLEGERKAAAAEDEDTDATDDERLTQPQPGGEGAKPAPADSKTNTTLLDSPPSFEWDENDSGSDSDALISQPSGTKKKSTSPKKRQGRSPQKRGKAAVDARANNKPTHVGDTALDMTLPTETLPAETARMEVETLPTETLIDDIPETQPALPKTPVGSKLSPVRKTSPKDDALMETQPAPEDDTDEEPPTQCTPDGKGQNQGEDDKANEDSTQVEEDCTQVEEEGDNAKEGGAQVEDHTQVEPKRSTRGKGHQTPTKRKAGAQTRKKLDDKKTKSESPVQPVRESPRKGRKRRLDNAEKDPPEVKEEMEPEKKSSRRLTRAMDEEDAMPPSSKNSKRPGLKRKTAQATDLKSPIQGKKLRSAEQVSLRSPHAEGGDPIRIMFSGLEPSAKDKKQISKIQATLLTDRKDYSKVTHLIAAGDGERFKRTPKVMALINCVKYILDIRWLHESAKLGYPVREEDFLVADEDIEKKYDFNLADTLAASQCDFHVLDGYEIYVTEHTCGQVSGSPPKTPSEIEIQDIVELAGGVWVTPGQATKKLKSHKSPDNLILISHPNALKNAKTKKKVKDLAAISLNMTAYLPELIFSAALRQELNFDSEKHILQVFAKSDKTANSPKKPTKATRRSKRK